MKASAALLAGLLAGLTLGALDTAQRMPTVISEAQARKPKSRTIIVEEGSSGRDENPMKGTDRKTAKCGMDCQAPAFSCSKKCGKDNACLDSCGKRLNACMQKCGVDTKKLENLPNPAD